MTEFISLAPGNQRCDSLSEKQAIPILVVLYRTGRFECVQEPVQNCTAMERTAVDGGWNIRGYSLGV